MSERNYYVFCDDNCKFPAMTKEETLAAIHEATGVTPAGIGEPYISQIIEQNSRQGRKLWFGTETQFNLIPPQDRASDTIYIVNAAASNILNIDRLNDRVNSVIGDVSTLESKMVGVYGWEQIWSNEDAESSFPPQTVICDVGDAIFLKIDFVLSTYYAYITHTVEVRFQNEYSGRMFSPYSTTSNTETMGFCFRAFTMRSNGVSFDNGYAKRTDTATTTQSNSRIIPVSISKLKATD